MWAAVLMIQLTRLNHVPVIVNADLIEHIDVTPDTVVALTTGQKFMVWETPEELIDKVIQFRKAILGSSGGVLKTLDLSTDSGSTSGDGKAGSPVEAK